MSPAQSSPDAEDPMTLQWYGVAGGLLVGVMSPDPFLFTLPTVILGFICMDSLNDHMVRKGRQGVGEDVFVAFGKFLMWLTIGGGLTIGVTYLWGFLT